MLWALNQDAEHLLNAAENKRLLSCWISGPAVFRQGLFWLEHITLKQDKEKQVNAGKSDWLVYSCYLGLAVSQKGDLSSVIFRKMQKYISQIDSECFILWFLWRLAVCGQDVFHRCLLCKMRNGGWTRYFSLVFLCKLQNTGMINGELSVSPRLLQQDAQQRLNALDSEFCITCCLPYRY